MPEGPSIIIAREQLERFTGKKILSATGSAPIDMHRLEGKKILRMTTWGKHLLFEFDGFALRIHFLMFGKYFINSSKKLAPRLNLKFARNQELNIYTSSVVMIEEPLDEVYDWTADIMSDQWNAAAARKKLKSQPDRIIADALMDQDIFAGLGNIIKNEVLWRAKIHPQGLSGSIPTAKLTALLREIRKYAFEFLEWKKEETLAKHWEAYKQKKCSRDGTPFKKAYFGKAKRRTFYCDTCQVLYT